MDYSLVLPAYNEVRRIGKTLLEYHRTWEEELRPLGKQYELIVVANGCRDGTAMLVHMIRVGLSPQAPIRLLALEEGNKGLAVLEGFRAARGRVVGFTDADGAIAPSVMLKIMQVAEGGKVAIGSKYLDGTRCQGRQPLVRKAASRGWNLLVRLLLGLRVTDTQAGAKAMPVECARAIVDSVYPCGFAFDVSLLWEARKAGYEIEELPIEWSHFRGSKFSLLKEVPRMFLALIRLRLGFYQTSAQGMAEELPMLGPPPAQKLSRMVELLVGPHG